MSEEQYTNEEQEILAPPATFKERVHGLLYDEVYEGVKNPYSTDQSITQKPWYATYLIEGIGFLIMLVAFWMSIRDTLHLAETDLPGYIFWGGMGIGLLLMTHFKAEGHSDLQAAAHAMRAMAPSFAILLPYLLIGMAAVSIRFTVDTSYLIPVEIVSATLAVIYFFRLNAINTIQSEGNNQYQTGIYIVMALVAIKSIFMFAGGLDGLGLLVFGITAIQILTQQSTMNLIANQQNQEVEGKSLVSFSELGAVVFIPLGLWLMDLDFTYWAV